MKRLGLVAGEASGDLIAANALGRLQASQHCALMGVGGQALQSLGMDCWVPSDRLAVRGYVEVLAHLPGLLRLRRQLVRRFSESSLDLFLGVDAPDFNLGLARQLKARGLRTAHLVSPSIWAWRADRLTAIEQAVDTMLCLFPHEPPLYKGRRTQALYVGHPLADRIPRAIDRVQARQALGLAGDRPVLALMPGSRSAEIARLGPIFLQVGQRLSREFQVCLPAASIDVAKQIRGLAQWSAAQASGLRLLEPAPGPRATDSDPISYAVLRAADLGLIASGTATLEAALHGVPMVIAYQVPALTYRLMRRKAVVQRIGLPNLLISPDLVDERLQDDCNPTELTETLLRLVADESRRALQQRAFAELHQQLAQDSALRVAQALGEMLA